MSNTKYLKYSPEWEQKNKFIIGKWIEKEFKKGVKKPDGTQVSTDTEKVKVNDYEELIREREVLKADYEAKKAVVKTKSGYAGAFAQISIKHDELETNVGEWKANLKTGKNYNNQSNSFLKSGSGINNPYKGKGWIKLITDYNAKKFTPPTATAQDYTNLYEVCLYSGNGHNQKLIKLTEQELIKFIARVLKEYEKIDNTTAGSTFQDYLTTKKPTGLGAITYTTYGGTLETDTIVNGYLTTLKAHADNLVETTDEKTGRTEYTFGHNFVNDNGTGMKDTPFGRTEIETFIKFTHFLHVNHVWTLHKEVKDNIFKNIPQKTELTFIPAQDKPYTEKQLHNWGQENYLDKSFANSDKATNFYGDIPKKDWKEKAVKYELGTSDMYGGIYEWVQLTSSMLNLYHNENEGRKERFKDSFDNNPYTDFWQDLNTRDDFGSFNDRATTPHYYTLHNFPTYAYEQEVKLHELKGLKEAELKRLGTGGEELRTAQEEANQAHQKVKEQEKAINDLITTRLKEKREVLKTKYKFDATTAPNFGSGTEATDVNRLTYLEHLQLWREIGEICFVETGDEEGKSSIDNENTAYDRSKELITESKMIGFDSWWKSVGWDKTKSSEENSKRTTEEKIKTIKENKDNEHDFMNINYIHGLLVEAEKKIKLDQEYIDLKTKLKQEVENQTPQENLKDWQNVVKKYEAGLETVFDQAKIDQWKAKKDGQDAFTNVASLEELIKKVVIFKKDADNKEVFDKVNENFINFIKGQDDKLKTLTDLFKEKEPNEVVKYVAQWEYDKAEEGDKDKVGSKKYRLLRFAWSEKGKKQKVDSKDKLEDSEKTAFNEYLYECAIGKINESLLTKPVEQSEDNDNDGTPKEKFHRWENPWMYAAYVTPVVVIGGLIYCFWDRIKGFFGTEEEETSDNE